MIKVLITGGSGFIGRSLLPMLAVCEQLEVHAISRKKNVCEETVFWHEVDLFDKEQVNELLSKVKADYLIHLAWITTPGEYTTSLVNYEYLYASYNLILSFIKIGGKKVFGAGTCFEYDLSFGRLVEEVTPSSYKHNYAITKNALHAFLKCVSDTLSVEYVWGRIFFPYGPNENMNCLMPSVIRSIIKQESILTSKGEQALDFIHVEDVAQILFQLLIGDATGIYNIGSGKSFKVKDIINIISEKLCNNKQIQFGALPYREGQPFLVEADTKKINSILSLKYRYDIQTGIDNTIAWWSRNLNEEKFL